MGSLPFEYKEGYLTMPLEAPLVVIPREAFGSSREYEEFRRDYPMLVAPLDSIYMEYGDKYVYIKPKNENEYGPMRWRWKFRVGDVIPL